MRPEKYRATDSARHRRVRHENAMKMLLLRPRCLICSAPIRHGATGIRRSTVTCGTKSCAKKAYVWFKS